MASRFTVTFVILAALGLSSAAARGQSLTTQEKYDRITHRSEARERDRQRALEKEQHRDPDRDRDHDRDAHEHQYIHPIKHHDHDGDEDRDRHDHHFKRTHGHPPGWEHGKKTGWGDCDLPPGQAKKYGCHEPRHHRETHSPRPVTTKPVVLPRPKPEVHAHAGVDATVK